MRLNWDNYFINMAFLASSRSTCIRRKVGAILVIDNHVLSSGYNGVPIHLPHCGDIGCLREKEKIPSGERHELCRGAHAEQNAITQAAVNGVSIKYSTLYCTHFPCSICSKMIINSKILKIVYKEGYPDDLGMDLLKGANIKLLKLEE